jgi:hypothetical protein
MEHMQVSPAKILILGNLPVKYCGTWELGGSPSTNPFGISEAVSVGTENCPDCPQNIVGKNLALRYSVFKELFLAALAGAIMHEFEMMRKVRCHTCGLWKTVEVKAPSALVPGLMPRVHF